MSDARCILHADMDAFFASVEQRDRPELRGLPVAVGGSSDRGVVAAASYEAREFGVRSAMPSFEARRLCPALVFLRGDMARYSRESRRIFDVFSEFSPDVEGLSLDEAFLDLTGSRRLLGPPREVGERLRQRVREVTGLAVSVGIAPVKMVAKIASDSAKPDGLCCVDRHEVRSFLDPLPVRRIWGVGPVGEQKLHAAGFRRVGDLARATDEVLKSTLGEWGLAIARLARGEDVREIEAYREAISYSEENTFAKDIDDPEQLASTILVHAEAVARRLRRSGVRARTVVLKWRLGRRQRPGPRGYPLHTRRTTLDVPTDDGEAIARTARALLVAARIPEPVRLIGVGVTNVEAHGAEQLSLFETDSGRASARRSRINAALDELSDRYGTGAVVRADRGTAERAGLSLQIKRGDDSADPEDESVRPADDSRRTR